jgi:hypothetical protein
LNGEVGHSAQDLGGEAKPALHQLDQERIQRHAEAVFGGDRDDRSI